MSWIRKYKIKEAPIKLIDGDRSEKYPKREEFKDSGIVFLNANSISGGRMNISNANYISIEKFESIKKGRVIQGDLIMTTRGNGVGDISYYSGQFGDALINAQMLIIRTEQSIINSKFLYYLFSSSQYKELFKNYSSGSAQPQLPITSLKEIEISYPDISTQNKIASILSVYDDLIENNLWRIKLLEEAAQNIYKEWFVHFRFPDYENTEFENGLPKGWTYRKLNSLCNFIGGFAFKSKNYKETGNYKIVTIKNVTDRRFDNSKFDYISELPAKMKEACKIQEGDILLSLTGNVGRTCLAFGSNLLLNQRVCIIEPINKTNSVFVYYIMMYPLCRTDNILNKDIKNYYYYYYLSFLFLLLFFFSFTIHVDMLITLFFRQLSFLNSNFRVFYIPAIDEAADDYKMKNIYSVRHIIAHRLQRHVNTHIRTLLFSRAAQ